MTTLTKHRKLIFDDLLGRSDHPTARSVYESARQICEKISFATVYNSLEYLVSKGMIKKLNINSESSRYDAMLSNHSHLFCTDCNKIYDIPAIKLPENIDYSEYGFIPDDITITVTGRCNHCKSD